MTTTAVGRERVIDDFMHDFHVDRRDVAERLIGKAMMHLELQPHHQAFTVPEAYAVKMMASNLSDPAVNAAFHCDACAARAAQDDDGEQRERFYADFERQYLTCADHREPGMVEIDLDSVWELTPELQDDVDAIPTAATSCHHPSHQQN